MNCKYCKKETSGTSVGYGIGDMKYYSDVCPECMDLFVEVSDNRITSVLREMR